jgi:hypothetical protein
LTGDAAGNAEGSTGVGFKVRNNGALGTAVRGEVATTGWGVRGISGGGGIGVQGEAGTGGAGVLAKSDQGTALLVEGSIGVRGSRPAAFVHTTTSGNITANFSQIDNPLTNGDPNAILIVTLLSVDGERLLTTPFGVWYARGPNRWTIFRADGEAMPQGVSFNVLVIKRP